MRRAVFCLMIVLLLAAVACADTFQNEPDGFRGIAWGTDISTLSGMYNVFYAPIGGGIAAYWREGDKLVIGGAKLESIEYLFWHGRFCGVVISTSGGDAWDAMKAALVEKFGEGYQEDPYVEDIVWFGDTTLINAFFNNSSKEGRIHFTSVPMFKEMEAYFPSRDLDDKDFGIQ